MAVATGVAECIVCWRAVNARSEFRMGGTDRAAPDTVEFQYQVPYGYFAPPQQFAMIARAYMDAFGVTAEDLLIRITQSAPPTNHDNGAPWRDHTHCRWTTTCNPRWVVEPLRLFDCCLETDAAVALVVTSTERARDLKPVPVLVSGAAFGSGHTLYSNGRADFTTSAAARMAPRLYAMAGIGPDELDVAEALQRDSTTNSACSSSLPDLQLQAARRI